MTHRHTAAKSAAKSPPQNPDRRQRRSAEIRERLFRAALALFGRKGFTDTTVEDITNEADVGKGTFFNHFPSKEHLLTAFTDMQLEKLQAEVEAMRHSNEPMQQFLENLSVRLMVDPSRTPEVVRALLLANLSSSSVRSVMQAKHARAEGLLTELVQMGQDRGEFRRDLSAREIAQVFRQSTFGTLLLWSVFGDASLPERIHTAISVLWLGVAPRDSVTPAPQQS
jgi:TetR/AcrR family transcriptional regulator, cholesterol catabolism regulator